jgi:hypothetical protein
MLDDLRIATFTNLKIDTLAPDTLKTCDNKKHFKNYPYKVKYAFNSRGFRDEEWPASLIELQDSIWCVGDSATVGIGQPLDHTWVNILQTQLEKRTINIGLQGASNDWIGRRAIQILNEISPTLMVIHWTFTWRYEDPDSTKLDEERRKHFSADINFDQQAFDFIKTIKQVEQHKKSTKIIHSFYPGFSLLSLQSLIKIWQDLKGPDWPDFPQTQVEYDNLDFNIKSELTQFNIVNNFKNSYILQEFLNKEILSVPEFEKIDLARDGFHYDQLTARRLVDQILLLTKTFDRQ